MRQLRGVCHPRRHQCRVTIQNNGVTDFTDRLEFDELLFRQHSKLFWSLRIWKVMPAVAAQLRFLTEAGALPDDIEDGIQSRTHRTGQDPKPARGWLARNRLRLRRLADLDIGPLRARRCRRRLAAFQAREDTVAALPEFVAELEAAPANTEGKATVQAAVNTLFPQQPLPRNIRAYRKAATKRLADIDRQIKTAACDKTLASNGLSGDADTPLPSMAHEMAVPRSQRGVFLDVVTEHFNSDMNSDEAVEQLVAAIERTK